MMWECSVTGFNACAGVGGAHTSVCINSSSSLLQEETGLSPVLPCPPLCCATLHLTVLQLYSKKELCWQAEKESPGPPERCERRGSAVCCFGAPGGIPMCSAKSPYCTWKRNWSFFTYLPCLAKCKIEKHSYLLLWSIKKKIISTECENFLTSSMSRF